MCQWCCNLKRFIKKDRIYGFLAGLNPEFDKVKVRILGKEELTFTQGNISAIQGEQSRSNVTLEPQTLEGSALVSKVEQPWKTESAKADVSRRARRDNKDRHNRDNLWCTYCKKPRYTKECCWKLNGKLPTSSREWGRGGQLKPHNQANLTEQVNQSDKRKQEGYNSEEIEKLKRFDWITWKTLWCMLIGVLR